MLWMMIKLLAAIVVTLLSFVIRWWAPIIVFPAIIFIIPNFGGGEYYELSKVALEVRRLVFYLVGILFIGFMTYVFHINIGSWYGWLIGMVLAWLTCGSIAADLEKYLFFRAR